MKSIEVCSAGMSDTGLVRSDNQDHFFVADFHHGMLTRSGSIGAEPKSRLFGLSLCHLFFVADGMGGHQAGSQASLLAIEYFVNSVLNCSKWSIPTDQSGEGQFVEDLKSTLINAHQMIQMRSDTRTELKGMGTTLTLAIVIWPKMYVVHAGDTRCYLVRNSELKLLTNDHTVANQMLKAGQLSANAAERSPWSNVLINALGAGAEDVFAEVHEVEMLPGDSILMCSDGLNKHVSDSSIHEVILANQTPSNICESLIALAKADGGTDNVTTIFARFTEPAEERPRMHIGIVPCQGESILQDMEMPFELDTLCDPITLDYMIETKDEKDTGEFFENDTKSSDSINATTAEYRPDK